MARIAKFMKRMAIPPRKCRKVLRRILIALAVVVIFLLLIPFPTKVFYHGTATEYSPIDPDIEITHEILIDGNYNRSVLLKNRFKGLFYISNVPRLNKNTYVDFAMEPNQRYKPSFPDEAGQPLQTSIFSLACDHTGKELLVEFCTSFNMNEGGSSWEFTPGASHFLVLPAAGRADAFAEYKRFLREF